MRKVILLTLVCISLVVITLRFGSAFFIKTLGLTPKAGLRVESNIKAKVFINQKEVGNSPYQDENLAEGEYLVSLKSDEATTSAKMWQGYVKLNAGTLSVINRELGDSPALSTGEVITLEKGKGVTVVSIPPVSDVIVDGKNIGKTPLIVTDLPPGEHQFIVGREDYLNRSIRVNIVDGFNLTMNVDLALAEADLSKITTPVISSTAQVVVKQTPTGFLRVRSEPNLNGVEIAKVKPGDSLVLLEELPSWDRVRLPDGKEGYVSSSFVEKKPPQ